MPAAGVLHWPNCPGVCIQDKSRVEIIVVDAGCKDNTMEAVASMKLGVKLRCTSQFYLPSVVCSQVHAYKYSKQNTCA